MRARWCGWLAAILGPATLLGATTCAAQSSAAGGTDTKKPDAPPNVLWIITDQQRWDTLGYTGKSPCRTPNLDRLASGGIAFDRCLTSGPLCSPSRAAMFTGATPFRPA